jgi:hypothetical protein
VCVRPLDSMKDMNFHPSRRAGELVFSSIDMTWGLCYHSQTFGP